MRPLFGGRLNKRLSLITEVPKNESENYIGLHGVQATQLQHDEKQEKHTRQVRDEQVLQILQEAYSP